MVIPRYSFLYCWFRQFLRLIFAWQLNLNNTTPGMSVFRLSANFRYFRIKFHHSCDSSRTGVFFGGGGLTPVPDTESWACINLCITCYYLLFSFYFYNINDGVYICSGNIVQVSFLVLLQKLSVRTQTTVHTYGDGFCLIQTFCKT